MNRLLNRIALLLAGLAAFAPTVRAADLWVAPNGRDEPRRGAKSAPWLTLQYAADHVRPGDSVHVLDGDYGGFHLDKGGPPGARTTFVAEGDRVKIVRRNKDTPDGINVENAPNVTIDGFIVNDMVRAGVRGTHADGLRVRRVRASDNGMWGIFVSHSDDVVIEYNVTVRSRKEHGIYFSNSGDRPVIRGNVSSGNAGCGIHMNADLSEGGDGIISEALVEGNTLHGNGARIGGSAINCDGVQRSRIVNNVLLDNHARGISLFRIDAAEGASRTLIAHNTIVMPAGSVWAIQIKGGSTHAAVMNNVLVHPDVNRGVLLVAADSLEGLRSDHNVVSGRFTPDDGVRIINLDRWRIMTGQDKASIAAKPEALFLDAAKGDLHLRAGSPAIDAGDPAFAPKSDRDNRPRASASRPDAGAYEYEAAPAAR